ncbi:MAG: hypothetical protein Q7U70_04060 [Methylotenera sp.]|nr:hypothetical protein [Methylotenera sp.]MDO9390036.1 hypothetical protein [Methylotenera sp.]
MKNKITEVVDASFEVISSKASSISSAAGDAGRSAYEAGKNASQSVGRVASTTALLVGDLNGDGKVDIEDAKIALAKAKQVGSSAVEGATALGKVAMESEITKEAVAGATVGAVIGGPLIGGPVTAAAGATLGAVLGAYKGFTKK